MSTGRRHKSEPPPIEVKKFTLDEIEHSIGKLKRRVEDTKALKTDNVRFDNQRQYNVVESIRKTILEVFGQNSPEYKSHQYHTISSGIYYVGMSEYEQQENFVAGINDTITMLEGLIAWLEEKREDFGQDTPERVRGSFEGLDLHPRIAGACADLYLNGHYSNAVLDASIALVNYVKERSGRHDLDGVPLMQQVFTPNNSILAFNNMADQSDRDEQQGMMYLFSGAVLALRNPRAHKLFDKSPEEATEYIALLSLLAKRLDSAKRRMAE